MRWIWSTEVARRHTTQPLERVRTDVDGATIIDPGHQQTHILVVPHDPDNVEAYVTLIRVRLRRHWNDAAISVHPVHVWDDENCTTVITWVGGPASSDVSATIAYHPESPGSAAPPAATCPRRSRTTPTEPAPTTSC
ncbi:hypothetical protein [Nocardia thailandica]